MDEGCRPGERVRVRRERWLVAGATDAGSCRLLSLRGIGPANLDDRRTLLERFEVIERLDRASSSWRTGRKRWRRACRTLLADCGGWSALRCADVGVIDVLPHQLEPSLAVIRGDGCRVLLADDVGLGKTIQAGLLVSELMARGVVRRVLFLTPPGLRDQWAAELQKRFGLGATIVDARGTAALTAELSPGENPWATIPLAIASIDYVKRPEVLPFVRTRIWDVVVVDEAHTVTPESDRHDAVSGLCESAVFVVLLTATPHSGDRHAFGALCDLGAHADDPPLLTFRRSRRDVRLDVERRVHRLTVAPSSSELHMFVTLERYASAIRQELESPAIADGELLLTILRKRALSSPESLRQSVARRLALLSESRSSDAAQLWLPLDEAVGEGDADDLPPMLSPPVLGDAERERQLLRTILDAATAAVPGETKLAALRRLLRRVQRRGEAAIVFTEYRDTLAHIQRQLGLDAAVLHGGLNRGERRSAINDFVDGTSRLLLATDAAGSGLNLHQRCRVVIHLELPWNPSRLEQRMGRVDRIGQRRIVHAFYLVASHSAEGDMLDHLRSRVERAQQDIDVANPLTSSTVANHMSESAAESRQSLALESAREAHRIELARRLRSRGVNDTLYAGQQHVAKARGRLRRRLRRQLLLIVGFSLEDVSGHRLATDAVGLLMPAPDVVCGPANRAAARSIASERADSVIANAIQRGSRDSSLLGDHGQFVACVRARAGRIEDAIRHQTHTYFQPGLFDQRAARLRHVLSSEQHELEVDAARRVSRFETMSAEPRVRVTDRLLVLP